MISNVIRFKRMPPAPLRLAAEEAVAALPEVKGAGVVFYGLAHEPPRMWTVSRGCGAPDERAARAMREALARAPYPRFGNVLAALRWFSVDGADLESP